MRAMIDPNRRTTGRPPGPPVKGTGWSRPREDGAAHRGRPRNGTGWSRPREDGAAHRGRPRNGTGWSPPRYGGTAMPDNLAARMKDSIVAFPKSFHIVDPRPLYKPPTGVHPSGAGSDGSHD